MTPFNRRIEIFAFLYVLTKIYNKDFAFRFYDILKFVVLMSKVFIVDIVFFICSLRNVKKINFIGGFKEDNCPICLDELTNKNSIMINCKHQFHKECLYKYIVYEIFDKSNVFLCPICRTQYSFYTFPVLGLMITQHVKAKMNF